MLFSLLSITYGGIGYRFFTDSQLKILSLSAIILGIIGIALFVFGMELRSDQRIFNSWGVAELVNLIMWSILFYYLENLVLTDVEKDKKNQMITVGALGSIGATGLVGGLIFFRRKRTESTELSKVREVYERLTSNQ